MNHSGGLSANGDRFALENPRVMPEDSRSRGVGDFFFHASIDLALVAPLKKPVNEAIEKRMAKAVRKRGKSLKDGFRQMDKRSREGTPGDFSRAGLQEQQAPSIGDGGDHNTGKTNGETNGESGSEQWHGMPPWHELSAAQRKIQARLPSDQNKMSGERGWLDG